MSAKNYYQVLEVDTFATPEEIKKAYYALARQHHPDVNPNKANAEQKFKEINEAYTVLSNPQKRTEYDQINRYWQKYKTSNGSSQDLRKIAQNVPDSILLMKYSVDENFSSWIERNELSLNKTNWMVQIINGLSQKLAMTL